MKKKILIAVGATVLILIIASVYSYFSYLSPRLKVRSFTSDLAPIADQDANISKRFADFSDYFSNQWKPINIDQDPKGYVQSIIDQAQLLVDTKKEAVDALAQINGLDSSADTETLKHNYVDLNEFYIDVLPGLPEYQAKHDYVANLVEALEPCLKVKESTNLMQPASIQEMASMMNSIDTSIKTSEAKIEGLAPPQDWSSYHKNLLANLNDLANYFDKVVALTNSNTNLLEFVMAIDKRRAQKWQSLSFSSLLPDLSKYASDNQAKEKVLLQNAQDEVQKLNSKYGTTWVQMH